MVSVRKSKIFASLLVAVIVGLLVFAGPAEGISANLKVNDAFPTKGQIIQFMADVESTGGEVMNIQEITLRLSGANVYNCKFDVNGNIINGCPGVKITRVAAPSLTYGAYGYGYGYGYGTGYNGKLTYEIRLDTSDYNKGEYTTSIIVNSLTGTHTQNGGTLNIRSGSGGGSCTTDWTCTAWSACDGGVQTRTCERAREGCYAGMEPVESRICTAQPTLLSDTNSGSDSIVLNGGSDSDDKEENVTMDVFNSAITGAVTGAVGGIAGSGLGLVIGLLVALIVLMIIIIAVVRKQRQTMPSRFYF